MATQPKIDLAAPQRIYKAHIAYFDQHPEMASAALDPINQWGKGEITLAHAIALALQEAHEMGARGEPFEVPKPVKRLVRSRP